MEGEDRQAAAGLGIAILAIGLPLLTLLVLLFATGWFIALGKHPQGPLWGWLSSVSVNAKGEKVYEPGKTILIYYLGIVTLYLFYQVCELLALGFREFRAVLS